MGTEEIPYKLVHFNSSQFVYISTMKNCFKYTKVYVVLKQKKKSNLAPIDFNLEIIQFYCVLVVLSNSWLLAFCQSDFGDLQYYASLPCAG